MNSSASPFSAGRPSSVAVGSAVAPLPFWKRALDLACCAVALPVLAVATLVAFIMTSVTSPGPVFFRQERVGFRGRRFMLYKFRTMHVSADVTTHQAHFAELVRGKAPMLKLDARGDSRLIPGGWLFRASGLDELPQIINVLRGEMSLVGPRPCIPYEYVQYTPPQRQRFGTAPGLTGLWQVSGKNRTTFEEMVRLDIDYVARRSLWLDVRIMLFTPAALLRQISDTRKAKKGSLAAPAPSAAGSAAATAASATTPASRPQASSSDPVCADTRS